MFFSKVLIFLVLFGFVLNACTPVVYNSSEQYLRYISDDNNGLIQKAGSSEVQITAKHIPPQLRVVQDIERDSSLVHSKDSLLSYYANSQSFIVSFKPTTECRVRDLRYFNVGDESDYDKRQSILHYSMAQYFTLEIDSTKFHPQLCHLEQDYASGGGLTFVLVFVDEKELRDYHSLHNRTMSLYFEDPFFELPAAKFEFRKRDLQAIPQLKI